MINWFYSPREVGIYSANYQLIQGAIGLVAAPVLLAAHPFLMKSWGIGDKKETEKWLGEIINWFLVIGILLCGITVLYSEDFAIWFLGPDFRQGHIVMPIILAGFICWQLGMYAHKPLEFTEQTRIMLRYSLYTASLNLILNLLFVPFFGYIAAAYTTLVSYLAYSIAVTIKGRKIIKWLINFKNVIWTLLVTVIVITFFIPLKNYLADQLGYWQSLLLTIIGLSIIGSLLLRRRVINLLRGIR